MNIKRLPLADRLGRLSWDEPAYPEHTTHIIQCIADMPIMFYMWGCAAEFEELVDLLGVPQEQLTGMTYADVAAHVNEWYTSYSPDEPQRHTAALRAVELLAVPLLHEYQKYTPSSDNDGDENFEVE